ncbi:hypothetical protein [Anaerococcus sp. AGMB09787]|uniref:hypothetical protein n=1 Tax=Anaerococcus sp. AGMB09787 TaxID=2922869 RepID=UPI001FAF853E|nr:hypothetical protein [Anaerococcus sp. AGMB09787]
MKVKNYIDLQKAIDLNEDIELTNSINAVDTIKLNKGQKIFSNEENLLLSFINGDGLALRGDNEISNIAIQTTPSRRAIYIDSDEEDLGEIKLNNLTITGMVQLLTRGNNKKLSVKIDTLDILAADARNYPERPMKYGVNVYQGALTIYNFNPKEGSEIRVSAENISLGRQKAPVIGSGVFISGFNDESGKVIIDKLTTNDIYTNGMIPTGQPNLITGAIFIVYGAHAKEIISNGKTVTYGTNDMVLDVWGEVDDWVSKDKILSYGSSAIGFVNFGHVKNYRAEAEVSTFGLGARGFNQYDGSIENAEFKSIKTLGDGSIGMQFSKPVGTITIKEGVETTGSTGETLVKGEIKELQADGISVLEGGEIKKLVVEGNLTTKGEEVVAYHVNGGKVKSFELKGKISAKNENSKEVLIENNGESDLSDLREYL